MTNADKFKTLFGMYATELWAKPEQEFLEWLNSEWSEPERKMIPTTNQIRYAMYLAERMCVETPEEFTREAYSDFISYWKPIVKHEDDAMNEPSEWQMQY